MLLGRGNLRSFVVIVVLGIVAQMVLDLGPIATVVMKPTGVTDPKQWLTITAKAATCTACHDSPFAMGHVVSFGGGAYGSATQAQAWNTQEICEDCHAAGNGLKAVDVVHGQK